MRLWQRAFWSIYGRRSKPPHFLWECLSDGVVALDIYPPMSLHTWLVPSFIQTSRTS
jgi:hypothetical protein